ncbi:MAG: DMT family transporter [Pseudomonadota bacterium]|nr:MAG: DMT family transporter [Pseudomonadota bacterium]
MSVPVAIIGVVLIWATTPLAIKWSGEGGIAFAVTARMVIGALLCGGYVVAMRVPMPWHRRALMTYLAAGIGIFGAMYSVYWGAQHISSGLVSVLFGLTPILTGLLAIAWLGEQSFSSAKALGIAASLLGLVLVFADNLALGSAAALGIGAVLLAVALHSLSTVLVKTFGEELPAMATTTGGLLVSLPAFVLSWWWFDGEWPVDMPQRAGASILYLGVFGSAVGFALFYYALRHLEAGRVALIPLVTPVLALLVGAWFNEEIVNTRALLGTALIIAGLGFYQWGARLSGRIRKLVTREARAAGE